MTEDLLHNPDVYAELNEDRGGGVSSVVDPCVPDAGQIIESIEELGKVQKANVEFRVISLPMMFKLYLLNEEEVFFGFYPVVERDVPYRWEERSHLRCRR